MKNNRVCNILGVNINIMSMQQVKDYICNNIDALRGRYICVSNVHTTVMSHDDESYCNVQNSAALRLPDGKPLSIVAKHRGFEDAVRVTGPDLMGELFADAGKNKLRHYFYGSTQETLDAGPDVVWVGLGAPKQERWMYYHRDRVNAVMIGVGAGFDYYADNIKRAPKWMQKCSLEWLYRLMQDPKRLARRYMDTNYRFIRLVKKENSRQ